MHFIKIRWLGVNGWTIDYISSDNKKPCVIYTQEGSGKYAFCISKEWGEDMYGYLTAAMNEIWSMERSRNKVKIINIGMGCNDNRNEFVLGQFEVIEQIDI